MTNDPIIDAISMLTKVQGHPVSAQALLAQSTRNAEGRVDRHSLVEVLRYHGYENQISQRALNKIPALALPVVLVLKDGGAMVLTAVNGRGKEMRYTLMGPEGDKQTLRADDLAAQYAGFCWFIKPKPKRDDRSELPEYTFERAWFWKVIWRFKGYYFQVVLATVLINFLALVGSLYVMNVYDRVIPNKAFETLWALSIGVILANVFEFIARMIRAHLTDIAGKKADLIISAALFRRLMAIDLKEKPASAGSYANNLKDFESVRDFMTSASLLALVDLPFVLLFITVIWVVAGKLALVPLLTIPLVVVFGLIVQLPMARLTNESMREGAQRQGLVVEAIEGIETLKTHNATSWAQSRWDHFTAVAAAANLKLKDLSTAVMSFAVLLQQANTVGIILWGTYMIHDPNPDSRITMGALIATVILSGRTLSSLSQVAGLMTKIQQTRTAMMGLDSVLERSVDRDLHKQYITPSVVEGELQFKNAKFSYADGGAPAVQNMSFHIKPGEKVGIVGRIGSGKSTLLRLAAGLYQSEEGMVKLDGVDVRQIDPSDVRAHMALLSQHPRLFMGSLRENLGLGLSDMAVNDEQMIAALAKFGMGDIVNASPYGLNMPIGEDGAGLSGGQKQMLCLARMVLRDPQVVLLDEPTSDLDGQTEQLTLNVLKEWSADRTLLVVTHRPQVLSIVDRLMVVDGGKIVMDGPRDAVLQRLSGQQPPPQQAQAQNVEVEKHKRVAAQSAQGGAAQQGDNPAAPQSPAGSQAADASSKPVASAKFGQSGQPGQPAKGQIKRHTIQITPTKPKTD